MLDKFTRWYSQNYTEITWFIVGFLVSDMLSQLAHGNLVGACISAVLALANYLLYSRG